MTFLTMAGSTLAQNGLDGALKLIELSRSTMEEMMTMTDALRVPKATIPVLGLHFQRSRMYSFLYSIALFVAFLNNVWY